MPPKMLIQFVTLTANDENNVITTEYKRLLYLEEIMFDQ